MQSRLITRLVAAGVALAVLIAALPGFTVEAQTRKTLKIALLTSSSTNDAAISKQALQGAQLAIEIANLGGGVVGPADDASTPTGAKRNVTYTFELVERKASTQTEMRTAIQASIEDKPVAMIGPVSAELANNNLDLANTARILQLTALPTEPTGTNNPFILRMRATDEALSRDLANYLAAQRYNRKIATAADNSNRAGREVAAFDRAARAAGVTPSPTVTYDTNATDLSDAAKTLFDANPDVVAIFGSPSSATALIGALRARGYTGQLAYGSFDRNESEFFSKAGSVVNGIIASAIWTPDTADAGSVRFAAAYQLRFGEPATAVAMTAFDSVAAIAVSVKVAGGNPVAVRDALLSVRATGGVQGIYTPAVFGTAGRAIEGTVIVSLSADGRASEQARYGAGACLRNCGDTRLPDITRPDAPTVTATRPVSLALIAPLTGPDGEIGRRALRGAQLAVNQINTAGGLIGPQNTRYVLDLRDLGATSAEEVNVALRTALSGGAAAILGPTLSGHLLPNLNVAPAARVPLLTTGTASAISGGDSTRFVLQLRPVDSQQAAALASYLTDIRTYTRFAVAAATTTYGQESVSAFTSVVNRYTSLTGARVVASTSHPVTATDFSEDVRTILAADPQVVVIWSAPPSAAALIKALRAAGYTGLIAYGAVTNPDFLGQFAPGELNNVIGTASWSPVAVDAGSKRFVEEYRNTYGELPDSHAAAYYDAVYMIAAGIRANGPTSANLQTYLTRLNRFAGVQGEYKPATYNNGQLSATVMVLEVAVEDGIQTLREISRFENGICISSCY